MDKKTNNNGYDYVDLGLPSGTLWASCNVGADKPSDSGLYFQWGDTKGYTNEQIGKDKQFNWKNYKWNPSGDGETFTKYKNNMDILYFKDDAAHIHMGGDWHIPTPEQIKELIDYTTNTWTTLDGINGRLFASKKDTSKSIFIPAAGYAWEGSVDFSGNYGAILSSIVHKCYVSSGQALDFYSGCVYLGFEDRYVGFPVRGVIDKKTR